MLPSFVCALGTSNMNSHNFKEWWQFHANQLRKSLFYIQASPFRAVFFYKRSHKALKFPFVNLSENRTQWFSVKIKKRKKGGSLQNLLYKLLPQQYGMQYVIFQTFFFSGKKNSSPFLFFFQRGQEKSQQLPGSPQFILITEKSALIKWRQRDYPRKNFHFHAIPRNAQGY